MTDKKKPLTVDDLWSCERVGAISLSPDGTRAVCTVTTADMEANESRTSLWLLSTLGSAPRRLTRSGKNDGQPAWSPSGEQIAFVAKREVPGQKDETPQLHLIAPDGGEPRRISNFAPGIEAFKWLPDGRRIVFVAWVWPELRGSKAQAKRAKEATERKASGYATSEAQYRHWDRNLPMGRVPHLHLLDVESGRITDLFEGSAYELPRAEPNADAFDIAPDGRHLVFMADPQPEKRVENVRTLVELNLKTGRFETMVADPAWDFDAPRYAPDSRRVAMLASHLGRKHTMPAHAAVVERGGRWQLLSESWDRSAEAPLRWSSDAATLYFPAQDRGRRHLYRYALASRSAGIAIEGGWVQAFDVAAEVLVGVVDTAAAPARVQALRAGGAAERIEAFNDALLASIRLGSVEEATVAGAEGAKLQMWLTFPPRFDPRKKYPVLHHLHGGPHAAAGDTFHYRWNTQAFAAQGYVVASLNYHGSSGFGQAFVDSITHRWGELERQDIEAATDWLLRQPWSDKRRIHAAGGSYGGYLVAWLNGHAKPGRYASYVCHAGCFDWQAMFADDAYTWHAKELGAWYWEDPKRIRAQSPSAFVDAMATPTLVIHGALDYRVPDQQGLAYYNTLKARGIEARLLWFPDENHWILKPQNSRLWYAEVFEWLKRHDAAGKTPAVEPAPAGKR